MSSTTDLTKLPVLMQGFQPCCVEAAVCAYIEYYHLLKTGVYTPLSFRFLATLTAAQDGINYEQSGTSLAVALEIAKNTGVCTAATYPNAVGISPSEFIMPSLMPATAMAEAAQFKIPDYKIVTDISWEAINAEIEQYKLVLTGLYIDKDWYLSTKPNSNPLPLPPPANMQDPTLSKHMTLSYGYDEQYRYVRNSFGTTFGQNGDAWYGQNYQPYIFSAAVILDDLAVVSDQVAEIATEVKNVNPQSPNAPQQETLLEQVVEDVEEELKEII